MKNASIQVNAEKRIVNVGLRLFFHTLTKGLSIQDTEGSELTSSACHQKDDLGIFMYEGRKTSGSFSVCIQKYTEPVGPAQK
jgi:hypothetical protein